MVREAWIDNVGGQRVLVMPVGNGLTHLKSVTIDEDLIVGRTTSKPTYDRSYNDLFVTDSWKELIDNVGIALAIDIRKQFNKDWRLDDNLKDGHVIDGYIALIDFTTAACILQANWHDDLASSYPFDKPFDDVLIDIMNWQQVTVNLSER
jgi:hypothetical protein